MNTQTVASNEYTLSRHENVNRINRENTDWEKSEKEKK